MLQFGPGRRSICPQRPPVPSVWRLGLQAGFPQSHDMAARSHWGHRLHRPQPGETELCFPERHSDGALRGQEDALHCPV